MSMEHSEIILDEETLPEVPPVHFKRSVILLRLYGAVVIVFFLLVLGQIFSKESRLVEILAGLTGFGVFLMLVASPFGIFFTLKAFRTQEGNKTARVWHLICHVLVLVFLGWFFIELAQPAVIGAMQLLQKN